VSIYNPDSGLITYKYNEVGSLVEKVDPNLRAKSQTIKYVYDDYNRLVKIDYPTMTDVVLPVRNNEAGENRKGRIYRITDESE